MRGRKIKDYSGQIFPSFTVKRFFGLDYRGKASFLCKCNNCGNEIIRSSSVIKDSSVKSCGCIREKHNKSHSKSYKIWMSVKNRCNNLKSQHFRHYGGRGIKLSRDWLKFNNFYRDMGDPPKGLSLDRIDNNKGYSKENCRWATRREQGNNKRNNRILRIDGRIKTMSEWAREYGISSQVIFYRMKNGWSIKDAVTVPRLK